MSSTETNTYQRVMSHLSRSANYTPTVEELRDASVQPQGAGEQQVAR